MGTEAVEKTEAAAVPATKIVEQAVPAVVSSAVVSDQAVADADRQANGEKETTVSAATDKNEVPAAERKDEPAVDAHAVNGKQDQPSEQPSQPAIGGAQQ